MPMLGTNSIRSRTFKHSDTFLMYLSVFVLESFFKPEYLTDNTNGAFVFAFYK